MSDRTLNQDFGHSKDCPVDGKPPNKICTCGAEKRAREAVNAEREALTSKESFPEIQVPRWHSKRGEWIFEFGDKKGLTELEAQYAFSEALRQQNRELRAALRSAEPPNEYRQLLECVVKEANGRGLSEETVQAIELALLPSTKVERPACAGCGLDATDACPYCDVATCGDCSNCEHAPNRAVSPTVVADETTAIPCASCGGSRYVYIPPGGAIVTCPDCCMSDAVSCPHA